MRKIYRIFTLTIITTILINILGNAGVRAMEENDDGRLKRICEEVRDIHIEDEVKNLVTAGMIREDAEYYYRLNNLVKRLEEEKIQVLIKDNIEDISDKEFLLNKAYYRERILQGDKRAIKKALKSLDNLINGGEYAERVINTFSDKAAVEILYPDGAKISYVTRSKQFNKKSIKKSDFEGKESEVEEALKSQWYSQGGSAIYKPYSLAYEEVIMEEGFAYGSEGSGWREGEWAFESGLAFSKVYLYTEFQLGSDGVSKINYVRGGQSSYGIINIANSTGGVISRPYSQDEGLPAEGRNEVIFTVSGSFGASFLILSLAAEPGMNWTQYIIFRLYPTEKCESEYRAKYRWYAAEYK